MPALLLYCFKLSVCLFAVCLFYSLVLRRLTFYNWNRWYLLGYTVLSFFLPLINIAPVLEQNKWVNVKPVKIIPVMDNFTNAGKPVVPLPAPASWNTGDILLFIFGVGVAVMLVRLGVQWLMYLNIKRKAKLLSSEGLNLYEVASNIVPFSFGSSVFINPQLHREDELKEILRHEYVHVRQKHTLDIIWGEIICLFNWYNPFAWLLRHHIRQNLEFIADNKVLENGMDKKHYQYLLLKVIGVPQFYVANSFNFSSLKKRIVMMNKMKSAKAHLVKFLFLLPLAAVLLLAFRKTAKINDTIQEERIMVSGLVVQGDTYEPLPTVHFKEAHSNIEGTTDERGFYSFTLPVSRYPYKVTVLFSKKGYETIESNSTIGEKEKPVSLNFADFIGMAPDKKEGKPIPTFIQSTSLPASVKEASTYALVLKKFEEIKRNRTEWKTLEKQITGSEKPYWVINGHSYILFGDGGSVSLDTLTNIVMVDGKKMTGAEVNANIKRSSIHSGGAISKEEALKKYGIHQPVLEIFITTKPDSIPPSSAIHKESEDSEKPYVVMNGETMILIANEKAVVRFAVVDIVVVDGKIMTGKEVNEKFKRSDVKYAATIDKEEAKKKYGINQEAMEIFINTNPPIYAIPSPEMHSNFTVYVAGIVIDLGTNKPISGAGITVIATGQKTTSDDKGYYSFAIPLNEKQRTRFFFEKAGYVNMITDVELDAKDEKNSIGNIVQTVTMKAGIANGDWWGCNYSTDPNFQGQQQPVGYKEAKKDYEDFVSQPSPNKATVAFLRKNTKVQNLVWSLIPERLASVYLKSGKVEHYQYDNLEQRKSLLDKYGALPYTPNAIPPSAMADYSIQLNNKSISDTVAVISNK